MSFFEPKRAFERYAEASGWTPPVEPELSDALVRELIQEEEEAIRGLDYLVTRHRTRLAWLRAVQKGTIKP